MSKVTDDLLSYIRSSTIRKSTWITIKPCLQRKQIRLWLDFSYNYLEVGKKNYYIFKIMWYSTDSEIYNKIKKNYFSTQKKGQ